MGLHGVAQEMADLLVLYVCPRQVMRRSLLHLYQRTWATYFLDQPRAHTDPVSEHFGCLFVRTSITVQAQHHLSSATPPQDQKE